MRCYKTIGGYFAREADKAKKTSSFSSFFDDGREEQEGEGEEEENGWTTSTVHIARKPSSGSALRSLHVAESLAHFAFANLKEAMRFARKASALSPFFCKLSIWSDKYSITGWR